MAAQTATAVVLLNRDLRVHDHPALVAAASEAERVVPLFVLDDALLSGRRPSPNRIGFLHESLADLDASLRRLGGGLVVRRGDPVEETLRLAGAVGATAVHASADVSAYARERERRLERACRRARLRFSTHPGVTVVPAGDLAPAGGDHYRVFTPYWRRWRATPWRAVLDPPPRLELPAALDRGRLPSCESLARGTLSPDRLPGGERAGRARLAAWIDPSLPSYGEGHDDLSGERTSRLSPYLHLGCLSPLELSRRVAGRAGGEAFSRQLCWRDFFHQLLAANPRITSEDYRSMGDRWRRDDEALARWKEGRTGYPIVDAGMRQLAREGWMTGRARLLTASFLVKDLGIDWRLGAAHFFLLLVDGDVAVNVGNWQWVAGTGTDTRPNRVFNPTAQARRFDPTGDYVRRYVPELAGIEGVAIHEPWRLTPSARQALDYPEPIVDHAAAAASFLSRRRARSRDVRT